MFPECVRKIMGVCDGNKAHFDLTLAKNLKGANPKRDYLVLHLADLIRMSFIAATSATDQLRLSGLTALQVRGRKILMVLLLNLLHCCLGFSFFFADCQYYHNNDLYVR